MGRTRVFGGRLEALRERILTYLKNFEEYDRKWGKYEAFHKDARPLGMPESPPEMPPELMLYKQCKQYNTLLIEGGLLDQPYWLWMLIQTVGTTLSNEEYRKEKILEMNASLRQ